MADADGREPDLTTEQVAAELQINPVTVQRYMREGRLSGYRVGRLWRVPRAALDALKAQGADLTPGRPPKPEDATPRRPIGRPRKTTQTDY